MGAMIYGAKFCEGKKAVAKHQYCLLKVCYFRNYVRHNLSHLFVIINHFRYLNRYRRPQKVTCTLLLHNKILSNGGRIGVQMY